MLTIWKFPLKLVGRQIVVMPSGAKILSVQTQEDAVCLWVMCNPDAPKSHKVIDIHGTGHRIPAETERIFIGTVQTENGSLVWHIFEIP